VYKFWRVGRLGRGVFGVDILFHLLLDKISLLVDGQMVPLGLFLLELVKLVLDFAELFILRRGMIIGLD